MSAPAVCVVCATQALFYAEKDGWHVHRCPECGLLFVWPMPRNALQVYEGDYFTGASHGFGYVDYDRDKEAMIPTFRTYLKKIARYLPEKGRMLDIGAATGFFLDLARAAGWETVGIEPSGSAAEKAGKKGLDVRTGILEAGRFAPSSFEAITMWDVLEHLPDPAAVLGVATELLKPGGVLCINTPDAGSTWARLMGARWHLLCPPEHLCLFSGRSLAVLLSGCGLKSLERTKIGKRFTLPYIAQTLAHWHKLRLWEFVAAGLQHSPIRSWGVPINLRDNVFVMAQKGV